MRISKFCVRIGLQVVAAAAIAAGLAGAAARVGDHRPALIRVFKQPGCAPCEVVVARMEARAVDYVVHHQVGGKSPKPAFPVCVYSDGSVDRGEKFFAGAPTGALVDVTDWRAK